MSPRSTTDANVFACVVDATQSVVTGAAYEWVKYTCEPFASPASSRAEPVSVNAFQPTCGTLSRSSVLPARRLMRPDITPRPSTPGASSLPSKSHCMPTQMPKSGVPAPVASAMASRHGASSLDVAPKWPTPGTITASARRHSSGDDGTVKDAPSDDSAFFTDVRLPAP